MATHNQAISRSISSYYSIIPQNVRQQVQHGGNHRVYSTTTCDPAACEVALLLLYCPVLTELVSDGSISVSDGTLRGPPDDRIG
jgi:hypothetical protein